MSRRRRPVVPVAAAVIGGVTSFLLFRLSQRPPVPLGVPFPAAVVAALPTAVLPTAFPVIDEESALLVPWTAAVSGAAPSPRWKIAFGRDGDVWTADGDGKNAHRVVTDAESPCWSPHRRMLAFARGGNVWVANADGTRPRPLTFWPVTKGEDTITIRGIAWNGHDNVLSFARDDTYRLANQDGDKREALYGSTLYHLALKPEATTRGTVALPFAPVTYETPTSPGNTGNHVVWRRIPPRFDLTEDHGHFSFAQNEYPAWSPTGTKMAFIREGDVWLAKGEDEKDRDDGGYAQDWEVSRIATSAHYDGHTVGGSHWIVAATGVSWAPDETWLVYGAQRISGSGQNDLHLLRRSKEDWKDTVLKTPGDTPSVSPDGRWILYTSRGSLYAMTPDQKKQIPLIKPADNAWCAAATW